MAESRSKSPIEIVKYLPGSNCDSCGLQSCFGFALALLERTVSADLCVNMTESGRKTLSKILAPAMQEVTFGVGDKTVKIGGEDVMYRHEQAFFGATAIVVDVWDTMSDESLMDRIKGINELKLTRYGKEMTVSAIAIRCVSKDLKKFADTVSKVDKSTKMPLMLCSLDAAVLKAGLEVVKDKKPLLYAATKENWSDVLELAKKHSVAVAISSPGDLNTLGAMAKAFADAGITNLILDPGTFYQQGAIVDTISNLTMLRRACVENHVKEVSYPTMAVPAMFKMAFKDPVEVAYNEYMLSAAMITKGVSLLVIHTLSHWNLMPLLYLREGMFKHPKMEATVTPGIYEFNEPDENSPLLVTSNYSLTYGIVSGDLERGKVKARLLVIDTGGLSVDSAIFGGSFSADTIADAMTECGVEDQIKHKVLILPGIAADIAEDFKDYLPDWKIAIGPKDSTQLPLYLKENWEKLLKEQ